MKQLLFLLLPLLSIQAAAQDDYFPMDSVTSWKYTVGSLIGSSDLWLQLNGDTIINGSNYRKVGIASSGFIFEKYMREEVVTRKVYVYDSGAGIDVLYYDFSLEVGDFFVTSRYNFPIEVVDKDIVMSECGPLDRWTLRPEGAPTFKYTEALGADFLFYDILLSDPVYFLDCAYSDSKKIFGDSSCTSVPSFDCSGQIILENGSGFFANTDAPITEEYFFNFGGCESICFSVDVSTNGMEWIGSGNLETNDECIGPNPCEGDPFNSEAGSCGNCWDFLYVRYFIGDSLIYENLLGDDPNDPLEATWEIQIDLSDYPGIEFGSVIVMGQTFATVENLSYNNLTVTCIENDGGGIDNDGVGYDASVDCDDNDPNVNPDSPEICDSIDNNCNGQIDEGLNMTYYLDSDGDGYGNPQNSIQSCAAIAGYSLNNTDCDDNNINVNPGATEICDSIDNNCNTEVDEGLFITYYLDADNDGYGDPMNQIDSCEDIDGYTLNNTDCDDTNPNINEGAVEIPNNGIDEDCDGMDEMQGEDNDGDGFFGADDCDDTNPDINPDATEICDGTDNNCDGQVDEGFVFETYYSDGDMDGYGTGTGFTDCFQPPDTSTQGGDCDDQDPAINPGAMEIPNNTIDEDCDGEAVIIDVDGDGWNSDLDCDDSNAAINPAAMEVGGNGIDEDCDGVDGPSSVYETETFTVEIFPNPVLNALHIVSDSQGLSYGLYTNEGRKIIDGSVNGPIDLTTIAHGIYLLKISEQDSDQQVIHKLVKL